MTENDVSRRTVLTAAAWSLPVIAIAAAAPAAAASGELVTLGFKPPLFEHPFYYKLNAQPGVVASEVGAEPITNYVLTITLDPIPSSVVVLSYWVAGDGIPGNPSAEGFSLGSAYDPTTGSYSVLWAGAGLDLATTPFGPNLQSELNITGPVLPTSFLASVTSTGAVSGSTVAPL